MTGSENLWRDIPGQKYDVILADPPWSYYGQKSKWAAAAKFYPTVSDQDMMSLPVGSVLAPRGVLFLWTTSPKLETAMECLRHWGLTFRGVAFVWIKSRKDGQPVGAQGIRPSIVKPTAEYVLAASRVEKGRPLKLHDESIPNVILSPKREHSQKPDEISSYIARMYPDTTRLEMFARTKRPGWDAWGNQVDHFGSEMGVAAE